MLEEYNIYKLLISMFSYMKSDNFARLHPISPSLIELLFRWEDTIKKGKQYELEEIQTHFFTLQIICKVALPYIPSLPTGLQKDRYHGTSGT